MKIIHIIERMRGGGAAKKTTLIANELSRRNNDVFIVTDTHYSFGFPLEPTVSVIPMYSGEKFSANQFTRILRKLKRVRRIVKSVSPDVVISVLPHVSLYVKIALLGDKTPIVFSDETSFARKDNYFVHFIRHQFYNTADAVVVLTENDIRLLGSNIPRKIAIHNPVEFPTYNGAEISKEKTILAIGPLSEWRIKGFDLLFEAFAKLADRFPDWKIIIAGTDPEPFRSQVINLAESNSIANRVQLLGFRQDIFDIMKRSSIYALSSRIEGFSLSLIEAISQECACVAFENYGVINEVTCGGKGVLIVKDGDVVAFSESLGRLMADDALRRSLAEEGIKCVNEYSINVIADKWEELLNRIAHS